MENNLAVSQKVKYRIIIWPNNPLLGVHPKRTEYKYSSKYLYMNVYSSPIHSNQKEATQRSINWCMDKQNIVYPFNEILFFYKKEWSTDTCYNVD